MKKLWSLIKASMTSDMSLFKIKAKKNSKMKFLLPIIIGGYLMFFIWATASSMFEQLDAAGLCYVLLSLFVFGISVMTIFEGIYKSGSLMFNCKDDDLLLSLPISKKTVIFIRMFKFYIFEVMFNSLFLLPVMISYIRWGNIEWTYYLVSAIMLLLLPIIPIVISCFLGAFISSISSRFRFKNAVQIIISMCLLAIIMFFSANMDGAYNYIIKHSSSINDMITKLYYPAGVYAKLVTDFKVIDLIIFIAINIGVAGLATVILSKFYFKINSRLKSISTVSKSKHVNIGDLTIKAKTPIRSLVGKEMGTFFKTPVFIINAGFALFLFLIMTGAVAVKYNDIINLLTGAEESGFGFAKDVVINNQSIFIYLLIMFTAFMTSITNSVISLEGKNINILKSLPVQPKTIIMGKVLASLVITTPFLLIGDIVLFIICKINIIEALLLLVLSILLPLVSHFVGIIVNLKFPKLDWENATEIVKQSFSSFLSVMIGMVLLVINFTIISNIVGEINSTILLVIITAIYILIDILLYLYLATKGSKDFNKLSV